MTPEQLARFEEKIYRDSRSGCWLWLANTSDGYATVRHGKMVKAHRASYEHFVGPIPDGLDLDHLCRVRCCVNPAHLEPVTRGENVRRGELGEVQRARMLSRTHCPRGHAYAGDNLYVSPSGDRRCRRCAKLQKRGVPRDART